MCCRMQSGGARPAEALFWGHLRGWGAGALGQGRREPTEGCVCVWREREVPPRTEMENVVALCGGSIFFFAFYKQLTPQMLKG